MPKGERGQAGGKQVRKVTPTNEQKPKGRTLSGEAQFRTGAGKAEGAGIGGTKSAKSGARHGAKRSSGDAKPTGTNVSEGGGSSAKGSRKGASGARGKSARST